MLDEATRKRLERMTRIEQRARSLQLRELLGLAESQNIADGRALIEDSLQDYEEYVYLKKLLEFNN